MDKIYLTENWHVWLPEDFVFSKLLAHLIQVLEELPDVAVVWIEALDVDKLLLVLVHVVVTSLVVPVDIKGQFINLLHLAAGQLLQLLLGRP